MTQQQPVVSLEVRCQQVLDMVDKAMRVDHRQNSVTHADKVVSARELRRNARESLKYGIDIGMKIVEHEAAQFLNMGWFDYSRL